MLTCSLVSSLQVRSSSRLHTLALRERVSTATLLVLASSAKSLKKLYVRRNAVIKRSDWARFVDKRCEACGCVGNGRVAALMQSQIVPSQTRGTTILHQINKAVYTA